MADSIFGPISSAARRIKKAIAFLGSDKVILLWGQVGSGKTTIMNMLTGGSYMTARGGFSCTREIQQDGCKYHSYLVIDFPGTGAVEKQMDHLKAQITCLKSTSFNTVCLVCSMSDRYDDLIVQLTKHMNLFRRHRDNLVIILTKCDDYTKEQKSGAVNVINEYFKISRVICKDSSTDPKKLSEIIYHYAKRMPTIEEGKGVFDSLSFKSYVQDTEDIALADIREEIEAEFLKIYEKITQKCQEDDRSDQEFRWALFYFLEDTIARLCDTYANKIAPLLDDEFKLRAAVIVMENHLRAHSKPYKEMMVCELEIENTVYDSSPPVFRKCPCGLIWTRVTGCSSVVCGNRGLFQDIKVTYYKYNVEWAGDDLNISRSDVERRILPSRPAEYYGLTEEEKKMNLEREREGKALINPMGCGRKMRWEEMVDATEEVKQIIKRDGLDIELDIPVHDIVTRYAKDITKFTLRGTKDHPEISDETPLENECVICFEYTDRKNALFPCEHDQYCEEHIYNLKKCALCYKDVKGVIQLR